MGDGNPFDESVDGCLIHVLLIAELGQLSEHDPTVVEQRDVGGGISDFELCGRKEIASPAVGVGQVTDCLALGFGDGGKLIEHTARRAAQLHQEVAHAACLWRVQPAVGI